ncbi:Arm DNA-binding domain-containing protein [Nitrosovibrio sp. Nv6]|uniref:Arm DNA-binding domain-containing protein n=1 Tax=Nitrosovibrio sp. Nv6 TaxID=1855340 RepID=UPI000B1DECFC
MPNGSKYWRFKYRFGGKEKRLAFGVYPDVPLTWQEVQYIAHGFHLWWWIFTCRAAKFKLVFETGSVTNNVDVSVLTVHVKEAV